VTFPAPPLEGFIVVLQHRPEVSRRLEAALSHAGATVFTARLTKETVKVFKRYQAHLVVMDSHDGAGVINHDVAFEAFHRLESSSICYSETQPESGFIQLSPWVDITLPTSVVVDEAVGHRRRMKV
jgi:predicted GTPase